MKHLFIIIIIVVVGVPFVTSFNVEANRGVDKFLLKQQSPDQQSYFGYKFQMSDYQDESINQLIFPVSAPMDMITERTTTADSTSDSADRPPGGDVEAMGNLFTCSIPRADYLNSSRSLFNCSTRPYINRRLLSDDVSTREGLTMAIAARSTGKTGPNMFDREQIAVCAPARIHACGLGTGKTEGSCYVSDRRPSRGDAGQFETVWKRRNPCYEQCTGKPIDMMFVLDGSGSVQASNFDKVKKWVEQVAGSFNIFNDTQVGVVQYSFWEKGRTEYLKTEIELGFFPNKTEFAAQVNKIRYQGYKTFTAHALNKTVKEDFMGSTGRYPNANRVLILLTDGKADDKPELDLAIRFAESQRVTRFAVGVANYDLLELEKIASSPEYVFTVSRFDQLQNIISKLQNSIETLEGHGSANSTNELSQCESGFSAQFDDNGRLLLGAVGAYDWSGTVAKYDDAGDKDADIPNYTEVQKVLPNRTKESYLGYSVTTGNYNGAAGGDYAASGAPRYWMRGAVVVYKPTDNSKMFDDAVTINPHADHQQFGSYFGGTLLSMDLNNDGKDDLLVAAPLYIGKESDEGRVFVYITGSGNQNVRDWAASTYKPAELKGRSENGARFGTAMASAGDLNKDGFNDVIIGAPLTEDGRGAVYVYHGSADGIISEPRQRIGASDVQGAKLQYFGQSLQGGVDLDGNNYPDVAVGAPRSDTIAIFRSRPVANFVTSVTFTKSKIDIFNCLEQSNRQCQNLTVCITISGVGVEPTATVDLKIRLDPTFGRLQFRSRADSSNGQLEQSILNETLVLNNRSCFPREIYLKSKIDNYNDPATAIFTYELTKEHTSKPLSSISDPSKPHSQQSEFTFEKKCAGKSICEYDLDLQAQFILPQSKLENGADLTEGGKRLVVASETDKTIIVQVNLTNTQQSAFDAQVVVEYSPQLSWNEITNVVSSNKNHQNCMQDKGQPVASGTNSSTKVIQYEYDEKRGNIMPKDHWCAFKIKLTWDKLKEDGTLPEVFIKLNAGTLNSQNDSVDITPGNNMKTENIPVIYKSNVDGKRLRSEDNVQLNVTETNYTISHVNEISKDIVQVRYKIFGRGYSNIPLSHISITYPAKFDDGLYLLYLYDYTCMTRDTPEMKTKCTCDTSVVNKLGLQVNNEKGVNETFSNATIIPNPNPFTLSEIDCNNATTASKMCETLRCSVENLDETQSVSVEARFRVWIPTFSFVMNKTERTVMKVDFNFNSESSSLVLNKDGEKPIKYTGQTDMIAELFRAPTEIQQSNQIWIYIVAGIAGVLLLLLAVFILYKCGFFKSKYAQKKEELEWQEADGAEEAT